MKNLRTFLHLILLTVMVSPLFAQEQGDTISFEGRSFLLTSDNLISNPGFESGFTGWTDATSSAAQLSSAYFTNVATGGVDNSKYLLGTTNYGRDGVGSIGTGWSLEAGKTYYFTYYVKHEDSSESATSEEWSKVSLTNSKTSADEPLILLDNATVDAGSVWTKNTICFTNSSSYAYIVARFRWLNGRLGFDNFALHEAEEVADNAALLVLISEAQELYDANAEGAADLLAAITAAENVVSSNSASDILEATTNLEEAIQAYKLLNASADSPLDYTSSIVNPSFEESFEGWTNDGFSTQSNSVFPGKEGSLYIETWVNRGSNVPDVSVEQTVTDLPNGTYKLTVAAGNIQQTASGSIVNNSSTPQTGAYIFAGNRTVSVDTLKSRSVTFGVFDNQVTIGLKTESATGNWVTCDDFRLEYQGFDLEITKAYVQSLADDASALLAEKMQDEVRTNLTNAIDSVNNVLSGDDITEEDLANCIVYIEEQVIEAEVSVAAYAALQDKIDEANETYADGSGVEADTLKAAIDLAVEQSNDFNLSLVEIYAATETLDVAIFKYKVANGTGTVPTIRTNTNFARGATMIFARATIVGYPTGLLLEHGLCYSTSPDPTVFDHRSTKTYYNSGTIYCIDNLEPSTVYYVRPYVITRTYGVGYGDAIKVITIPKGTITYYLNSGLTGDNLTRVGAAMEEGVDLLNNLTSVQGLYMNVYYGSGTPTAEASYGGYMRFGPLAAYQATGTMLHEAGHTIGVGTHSMWYGSNSPLRENGSYGLWLGPRTQKLMEFIDNSSSAYLTGDAVHMWPYGINGAHEDTGEEILYIVNSLIYQALGEDGLSPTSGFASPSYTFDIQDDTKYYLKSEGETTGLNTSYITVSKTGYLLNKVMTAAEALANDSVAWTIAFNPEQQYYTLQNVSTGRYFTYRTNGTNGISTAVRLQNPYKADYFQLMPGRVDVTVGNLTTKGYWIIHPENNGSPATLTSVMSTYTTTSSFNIADSYTRQRFLILTGDEVALTDPGTATDDILDDQKSESDIKAFSKNQNLHIQNILSPSDITIYNTSGEQVLKVSNITSSYTTALPVGVYLIEVNSETQRSVKKIVIQ